jgi:hypothetical protein
LACSHFTYYFSIFKVICKGRYYIFFIFLCRYNLLYFSTEWCNLLKIDFSFVSFILNCLHDSGVQYILCCVFALFFFVLLPVSLDCLFLIAPSVYSNVYLVKLYFCILKSTSSASFTAIMNLIKLKLLSDRVTL